MSQYLNNIGKINMFFCDNCNYQIASRKMMEIHNHTFHGQDEKYNRDICGYQVLNKISLARHKKIVLEGIKYSCRQCNHLATSKGNLAGHKRAVHEGVKYPCSQCNYQATSKGHLARHKRAVHEGI